MNDVAVTYSVIGRVMAAAAETTERFVRAVLTCPEHGLMRWREDEGAWTCAGFDGEGCDSRLERASG